MVEVSCLHTILPFLCQPSEIPDLDLIVPMSVALPKLLDVAALLLLQYGHSLWLRPEPHWYACASICLVSIENLPDTSNAYLVLGLGKCTRTPNGIWTSKRWLLQMTEKWLHAQKAILKCHAEQMLNQSWVLHSLNDSLQNSTQLTHQGLADSQTVKEASLCQQSMPQWCLTRQCWKSKDLPKVTRVYPTCPRRKSVW